MIKQLTLKDESFAGILWSFAIICVWPFRDFVDHFRDFVDHFVDFVDFVDHFVDFVDFSALGAFLVFSSVTVSLALSLPLYASASFTFIHHCFAFPDQYTNQLYFLTFYLPPLLPLVFSFSPGKRKPNMLRSRLLGASIEQLLEAQQNLLSHFVQSERRGENYRACSWSVGGLNGLNELPTAVYA